VRRVRRDNYATPDAFVAHARTHLYDRARLAVNGRACAREGATPQRAGAKIATAISMRSGGVAPFMRAYIWMTRVHGEPRKMKSC